MSKAPCDSQSNVACVLQSKTASDSQTMAKNSPAASYNIPKFSPAACYNIPKFSPESGFAAVWVRQYQLISHRACKFLGQGAAWPLPKTGMAAPENRHGRSRKQTWPDQNAHMPGWPVAYVKKNLTCTCQRMQTISSSCQDCLAIN